MGKESAEIVRDDDWEEAWLAELDRRERAARSSSEAIGAEWSEVRARLLADLARPPAT